MQAFLTKNENRLKIGKMKLIVIALCACIIRAQEEEVIIVSNGCEATNYGDIIRGMALGIQKDHSNVYSDCYLHTDRTV